MLKHVWLTLTVAAVLLAAPFTNAFAAGTSGSGIGGANSGVGGTAGTGMGTGSSGSLNTGVHGDITATPPAPSVNAGIGDGAAINSNGAVSTGQPTTAPQHHRRRAATTVTGGPVGDGTVAGAAGAPSVSTNRDSIPRSDVGVNNGVNNNINTTTR